MKTEVKVAIIGGGATIIAAIIAGLFGWLPAKPAPEAPAAVSAPSATPATPADETNINIKGNNNNAAGGNITIQGEQK